MYLTAGDPSMRPTFSHLAIVTAALTLIAATPHPAGTLRLREGSRLWFDGTSTVRSWSCTADKIDAAIQSSDADVVGAVLDGKKVPGTVQVDFPVARLECKNGTMNEHMRKALKATEHTTIRFALDTYELTRSSAVAGALQGTLQMSGQTLPITVPVQFLPAPNGALRVTGKVPVKMTDWGIKPPTLMLGTMKVGPTVTVNFDLQLQQSGTVSND
jgi:polyisoprenoid-binding protein YceI